MSADDLERKETELELDLYQSYGELVYAFRYIIHTERRKYLANGHSLKVCTNDAGDVYFDLTLEDAWVWDLYGQARFVKQARVLSFKDINIEELAKPE
ncbi:MAG: DUF2469 domain-containing protein [Actinomycetales bacterium]|nr:DUF2469 domain-containing protein [Actinomycetales bacterium]